MSEIGHEYGAVQAFDGNDTPPLPSALNSLEKEAMHLSETIGLLSERLDIFLRPSEPEANTLAEAKLSAVPPTAPVTNQINGTVGHLRSSRRRLEAILQRLDV